MLWRVALALSVAGLIGAGCKGREEKAVQAETNAPKISKAESPRAALPVLSQPSAPASAVEPAASAPPQAPAPQGRTDPKFHASLDGLIQWTETELAGLHKQRFQIEQSARQKDPELKAAYEAMISARNVYNEKLAAIMELAALERKTEELHKQYRMLVQQRDQLTLEGKQP
jgi:hypothetical protein